MLAEMLWDKKLGWNEPGFDTGALAPAYERIALKAPQYDHLIASREGGKNLLLNEFAACVRLYPFSGNGAELGEAQKFMNTYHPLAAPPIALVRMEDSILQIMPGLAPGYFEETQMRAGEQRVKDDTGTRDFQHTNVGTMPGIYEPVLFDTVDRHSIAVYDSFAQKGLLDECLERARVFDHLQHSFTDAWHGQGSFESFWDDMRAAKQSGLLVDAWNDTQFYFRPHLARAAARYETGQDPTGPQFAHLGY